MNLEFSPGIATLIAGKGYNIEGLSVGETHEKGLSLMTIEVIGDDVVIEQVVKQLRKLIDTIKVRDLTDSPHVERELALIKVYTATPRARDEVLRLTEIFRGKVVDVSPDTYTVEITGDEDKISALCGTGPTLWHKRDGKDGKGCPGEGRCLGLSLRTSS
jgi:acetolactate synthase-1/3 small subunit